MAGVARRHAVEVSCLGVVREFYLVPEEDRQLFAGINVSSTTPMPSRTSWSSCTTRCSARRSRPDSADVEAAYRLFVDVREGALASGYDSFAWWDCPFSDESFFDGILEGVCVLAESGLWYELDWEQVDAFMEDLDFSDPHATGRAWKAVLTYLLMDPRYLYLN